jgi:hypothetical protein
MSFEVDGAAVFHVKVLIPCFQILVMLVFHFDLSGTSVLLLGWMGLAWAS